MNAKILAIAPLLLALGAASPAFANTAKGASTAVTSISKADAKPIEDMLAAAQSLRDAIHTMLNEPAGPKRAELIKAGDRALEGVEAAMVNLPPQLLTADASANTYKRTSDRLQQATQDLNEAVRALASDPNSKRRNETMKKIEKALQETHELMHKLPRNA